MSKVTIQIGPGEYFDRLSIFRLKAQRCTDPAHKTTARIAARDLDLAEGADGLTKQHCTDPALHNLVMELSSTNARLWDEEVRARLSPTPGTAKIIQILNGRRSQLKSEIDKLCGEESTEIKEYV